MSKASKEQIEALFAAVEAGELSKVKALLKAGVSVDVKNKRFFDETPLLAAARRGQEAVFFELVNAGANLHAKLTTLETSVLGYAAQKGTLRMVQAVLADGLKPSDNLPEAFRFAADNVEMVSALIDAGANVNHRYEGGDSKLISAVMYNQPAIVALLLKHGARTDVRVPRDEFGDNKHPKKTALEYALLEGLTEIAELLKAAGATAELPAKPKRPTKAGPATDSWKRIDLWIKDNAPRWKPLKKGATADQIQKSETALGLKFPADLRDSYLVHNGSKDGAQVFPCPDDISYSLLTLSEIVSEWKVWKELVDGGEFVDNETTSDRGIQSDWWNVGWIPFAGNGGGDFLCVDLAPAKGGAKGQIIAMKHDSEERKLLAPSFRAFLFALANDLEDGKVTYVEDEGLV